MAAAVAAYQPERKAGAEEGTRHDRRPTDRVRIFDTTLRDGEQSPGISLNPQEKLEIAHQLARLGVDIIEAGFPIASPGDFEAVQAIAREVHGPVICRPGARSLAQDIDARLERGQGLRPAAHPHVHLDVSDIHIKHQLQSTREDVKGQARAAVAHAKALHDDVEFSPMDATRSDARVHRRGPADRARRGRDHDQRPRHGRLRDAARVRATCWRASTGWCPACATSSLSVHCHDDLGLAVANSFAGVQAGCRQVECAINGLGERAGNASLEEIVMLLTRQRGLGLEPASTRARSRARSRSCRA